MSSKKTGGRYYTFADRGAASRTPLHGRRRRAPTSRPTDATTAHGWRVAVAVAAGGPAAAPRDPPFGSLRAETGTLRVWRWRVVFAPAATPS
jgi:hypothetical protein